MIPQWERIHNDPWVSYLLLSLCVYSFHYVFIAFTMSLMLLLCGYMRILQWEMTHDVYPLPLSL